MEFCPNCGSCLQPKKSQVSVMLCCTKCGYSKQSSDSRAQINGKIFVPKTKPVLTVISEEDQKIKTMPTIRMECDKCGNNLVYVWQVQTRGGDEASTQFMRCTKCGHTFREYT